MSRAFVKEGSGELEPLPDLPVSAQPNYVTPRGLQTLRDRLVARQADLSAFRARQDRLDKLPEAAAERDIRYLESRLRSAILVDSRSADLSEVRFGHRVTVDDGTTAHTFEIVGEDEADASLNRIAPHSPLARALLGTGVGDVVQWRRPAGILELEVLDIRHADSGA